MNETKEHNNHFSVLCEKEIEKIIILEYVSQIQLMGNNNYRFLISTFENTSPFFIWYNVKKAKEKIHRVSFVFNDVFRRIYKYIDDKIVVDSYIEYY